MKKYTEKYEDCYDYDDRYDEEMIPLELPLEENHVPCVATPNRDHSRIHRLLMQSPIARVDSNPVTLERVFLERNTEPPFPDSIPEYAEGEFPVSFFEVLMRYTEAVPGITQTRNEEALRWFAALFKWSVLCKEDNLQREYARAMDCIKNRNYTDDPLYFTGYLGEISIPDNAVADGLVLPDLTWRKLMNMLPETLHETLLHRSAFLLSCCAGGLGNRKTWNAVTAQCVPNATAARCAVEVIHQLHGVGLIGYSALCKIFLGRSSTGKLERLCKKVIEIAKIKPGDRVVDPFCGDGTMLAAVYEHQMDADQRCQHYPVGFVSNCGVPIAEMHLRLRNITAPLLHYGFSEAPLMPGMPKIEDVDVVVSYPAELSGWMAVSDILPPSECGKEVREPDDPLGSSSYIMPQQRTKKSNESEPVAVTAVYRTLDLLKPGGRAVLIVPSTFQKINSKRLRSLHDTLAEHKYSFITLPDGCTPKKSQPLSLLLLRKKGD